MQLVPLTIFLSCTLLACNNSSSKSESTKVAENTKEAVAQKPIEAPPKAAVSNDEGDQPEVALSKKEALKRFETVTADNVFPGAKATVSVSDYMYNALTIDEDEAEVRTTDFKRVVAKQCPLMWGPNCVHVSMCQVAECVGPRFEADIYVGDRRGGVQLVLAELDFLGQFVDLVSTHAEVKDKVEDGISMMLEEHYNANVDDNDDFAEESKNSEWKEIDIEIGLDAVISVPKGALKSCTKDKAGDFQKCRIETADFSAVFSYDRSDTRVGSLKEFNALHKPTKTIESKNKSDGEFYTVFQKYGTTHVATRSSDGFLGCDVANLKDESIKAALRLCSSHSVMSAH